jgi:hypothetical protein
MLQPGQNSTSWSAAWNNGKTKREQRDLVRSGKKQAIAKNLYFSTK